MGPRSDVEFAGAAASEATAPEELRPVAYEERIDADTLGRHRALTAEIEALMTTQEVVSRR